MKRKLVSLLIDMLFDAFSFVFRLKDDSPGIPVTNFRELTEALAREGSSGAGAIRPADMSGQTAPLYCPGYFQIFYDSDLKGVKVPIHPAR